MSKDNGGQVIRGPGGFGINYPISPRDDGLSLADYEDNDSVADKADRLAEHLAEILKSGDACPHGFVFALCGSWGSGKTTFLNFLVNKLDSALRGTTGGAASEVFNGCLGQDECTNSQILFFNPWMFSSREALIEEFFKNLESKFHAGEYARSSVSTQLERVVEGARNGEVRVWLRKLCDTLLDAGVGAATSAVEAMVPASISGPVSTLLGSYREHRQAVNASSYLNSENELRRARLTEVRNGLRRALSNECIKPRLIIIDNVDRLSDAEIQSLFRFVGAVLDLPKLLFFLVFDRSVAEASLEKVQSCGGEIYLDKIVDAYLELPEIDLKMLTQAWLREGDSEHAGSSPYLAPAIANLLGTTRRFNHVISEMKGKEILASGRSADRRAKAAVKAVLNDRFPKVSRRIWGLSEKQREELLEDVRRYPDERAGEHQKERASVGGRAGDGSAIPKEVSDTLIQSNVIDESDNVGAGNGNARGTFSRERVERFLIRCFDCGADADTVQFIRELDDYHFGAVEEIVEGEWSVTLSERSSVWLALRLMGMPRPNAGIEADAGVGEDVRPSFGADAEVPPDFGGSLNPLVFSSESSRVGFSE